MPRFTDRFIANLKPDGAQRLEIKDDGCKGLAVRVTASRKTFCFRFKRNGRMYRITLGEYPIMTLGQAVVAANRRAADLHDGRNPIAEAQREEQAARAGADELTFNRLADRYLNEYAKPRKKSWKDDEWVLKRARAEFGPRVVSTITRKELVIFLRGLAATSVRNCNKTQASLCTMYNWANLEDETIINPLARIPKIGGREREEDRVVSDAELKIVWPALSAPPEDSMSVAVGMALRLIFLTAQRPIQVAGMRVDELVDLDGDAPRWELPASRMKRPKPHSVPLSADAVGIIKAALALRFYDDSPFVFPSTRGGGNKSIDRHALSQAVRRLRRKLGMAEWSPHDARRSATTWARASGIGRDVTEALTHHAIVGSGKAYDRYDMQAEKREAVDAIARYVARVTHLDEVGLIDLQAA
ncbi:site-specific integrase [Bradyrhizobium sp.]|uniref:tyrosine-type recombinase/integrase n=1 Tax=Bradyrhizobium sp. TaxID=376 RepID=UPI0027211EBA|nr:site-specific integrase [Bradyrhizobium sp.]MDO9295585.1 integrase arm-type DNA-binding domain-containing protein [Bradyrhizobium sp.]